MLVAIAAALAISANRASAAEEGQSLDWPAFLGPTNDGKSVETGIRTDWTEGLPLVWSAPLDESYAGPTVKSGRLFIADRTKDEVILFCLNAKTGEKIWQFAYKTGYVDKYGYNGGPRCSPVVDEERVYLFGPEGMLHAFTVDRGELVWSVDTAKKFGVLQNFFGVGSTPTLEGDLLIVQVGGSPPNSPELGAGDVKGNGSGIVAFDKQTGEVRYRLSNQLASYSSPIIRTINGKRRGLVFARGGLLGFDSVEGKELFFFPWRAPILESVNAANPVVMGDEVFISESYDVKQGGCLLSLANDRAEVIWRDKPRDNSMMCHFATPIYHEGYLYGCSSRHSSHAELRCIEWKTGKVAWSQPNLLWTQLLYVDGHFVVLNEEGVLRLVRASPKAYEEVAQWTPMEGSGLFAKPLLARPAWAAPVLSHGLLYLRGNHRLICVELVPNSNESAASPK